MSKNARRNFKTQTARLGYLLDQEEVRLLSGPAHNRVTGAGKHLRFRDKVQERKWAIRDIQKALKELGLPDNQLWFGPKDETRTINDLRRIAGWIRACLEHKPAMVVIGSLYCRNNGKGIGSPSHRATCETLPWLMKLWVSPSLVTSQQANGLRWLIKAGRYNRYEADKGVVPGVVNRVKNVKLLEQLVRVSPLARWVLASRLPVYGDLTHRDFDWKGLAGLNRAQMLEYVPHPVKITMAWLDHGIHVPVGFVCGPRGLAIKTFKSIFEWMDIGSKSNTDLGLEYYEAVFKLTLMFGRDVPGCIRYLESYMKTYTLDVSGNHALVVHDAAQKLPAVKVHPDWKSFVVSNFAAQHFGVIMDNLERMEEVCGGVPKSVGEARVKFLQAGVPWDFDLNFAEKSFVRVNESKNFEMCPHVEISEGEYTLRKLDSTDTRQLTAGRLTDCCQHLNGAGAACAQLAWTSGICAIYAAFKGERMVAQTFAWRAMDGSLVFDSIEALRDVNRTAVLPLFSQCADAVLGRLGVTRVLVGVTNYGITNEFYDLYAESKTVRTPDCMTHLGYSDAKAGCSVVCEAGQKGADPVVNFEYPEGVDHQTAVNQLMQGSEVFCEHCGAEVHPACEICPNCHADISEWVE